MRSRRANAVYIRSTTHHAAASSKQAAYISDGFAASTPTTCSPKQPDYGRNSIIPVQMTSGAQSDGTSLLTHHGICRPATHTRYRTQVPRRYRQQLLLLFAQHIASVFAAVSVSIRNANLFCLSLREVGLPSLLRRTAYPRPSVGVRCRFDMDHQACLRCCQRCLHTDGPLPQRKRAWESSSPPNSQSSEVKLRKRQGSEGRVWLSRRTASWLL